MTIYNDLISIAVSMLIGVVMGFSLYQLAHKQNATWFDQLAFIFISAVVLYGIAFFWD